MAFWTDPSTEPLMKYRFRITMGEQLWYAKSVQLPSYEITSQAFQLVNHKFKYPGLLTWNDIQITLVEAGTSALMLRTLLTSAGYRCPGDCTGVDGISKSKFKSGRPIIIEQLKPDGKAFQYWEIENWALTGAKFGDMSYENDEILPVEMTIAYDCATLNIGSPTGGSADAKSEAKKEEKKQERTIDRR